MRRRSPLSDGSDVRIAAVPVLAVILAAAAWAGNWPRFRGPNGQGLSDATTIPIEWSQQDIRWKVDLPGAGHSSPVVWGDRVFVTCTDDKTAKGILVCLNAREGRELWRKEQTLTPLSMNALNSFASSTPALDADHVYVLWPGVDATYLIACTQEGQEVWTAKLPGVQARHGAGASPIVVGDRVIVSCEQDEKAGVKPASVWLAVDCKSGQVRWRYQHPKDANASYSTPCVFRDSRGQDEVVFTSNANGIAALRADTGEPVWKVGQVLPARVVGSPVLADGLIIAACGEGGKGVRLSAVRPGDANSPASAMEVYGSDRGNVPYVPTPVVYGGYLFAFQDDGTVSCLRASTGEVLWSAKPAGRYYGSPVCVGGNLYGVTLDGDVVVLKADPKYELLAVNALGQKSHASPAVSDGRMFVRTFSRLHCVASKVDR
jgi:outer membrane protein assembly factor BamB